MFNQRKRLDWAAKRLQGQGAEHFSINLKASPNALNHEDRKQLA